LGVRRFVSLNFRSVTVAEYCDPESFRGCHTENTFSETASKSNKQKAVSAQSVTASLL